MTRWIAAVIASISVSSILGCVDAGDDSYPLLTRFPDRPMVIAADEWQRIRETLAAEHRAGVAAAADARLMSTP